MTIAMALLTLFCGAYCVATVFRSLSTGKAEDYDDGTPGPTRRRSPVQFWAYMCFCLIGGIALIVIGGALVLGSLWRRSQE